MSLDLMSLIDHRIANNRIIIENAINNTINNLAPNTPHGQVLCYVLKDLNDNGKLNVLIENSISEIALELDILVSARVELTHRLMQDVSTNIFIDLLYNYLYNYISANPYDDYYNRLRLDINQLATYREKCDVRLNAHKQYINKLINNRPITRDVVPIRTRSDRYGGSGSMSTSIFNDTRSSYGTPTLVESDIGVGSFRGNRSTPISSPMESDNILTIHDAISNSKPPIVIEEPKPIKKDNKDLKWVRTNEKPFLFLCNSNNQVSKLESDNNGNIYQLIVTENNMEENKGFNNLTSCINGEYISKEDKPTITRNDDGTLNVENNVINTIDIDAMYSEGKNKENLLVINSVNSINEVLNNIYIRFPFKKTELIHKKFNIVNAIKINPKEKEILEDIKKYIMDTGKNDTEVDCFAELLYLVNKLPHGNMLYRMIDKLLSKQILNILNINLSLFSDELSLTTTYSNNKSADLISYLTESYSYKKYIPRMCNIISNTLLNVIDSHNIENRSIIMRGFVNQYDLEEDPNLLDKIINNNMLLLSFEYCNITATNHLPLDYGIGDVDVDIPFAIGYNDNSSLFELTSSILESEVGGPSSKFSSALRYLYFKNGELFTISRSWLNEEVILITKVM